MPRCPAAHCPAAPRAAARVPAGVPGVAPDAGACRGRRRQQPQDRAGRVRRRARGHKRGRQLRRAQPAPATQAAINTRPGRQFLASRARVAPRLAPRAQSAHRAAHTHAHGAARGEAQRSRVCVPAPASACRRRRHHLSATCTPHPGGRIVTRRRRLFVKREIIYMHYTTGTSWCPPSSLLRLQRLRSAARTLLPSAHRRSTAPSRAVSLSARAQLANPRARTKRLVPPPPPRLPPRPADEGRAVGRPLRGPQFRWRTLPRC